MNIQAIMTVINAVLLTMTLFFIFFLWLNIDSLRKRIEKWDMDLTDAPESDTLEEEIYYDAG